jgi:NAD(P)H-flavin reductase
VTAPPLPLTVRAVVGETAEASTVVLDDRAGALAAPVPGQFNMLYPFAVGEAAISLSALADGLLTHTVRSVGPVSEALRRLEPGTQVGVRGPFGRGWPMARARGRDVVVVAGGIGLAPLRPAIHAVLAERAAFGRVLVLYGARSPADRLFIDELERWDARDDVDLAVTVDYADGGWRGRVGFVTALLPHIRFDPDRTIAMMCGPEAMMRAVASALTARGVPAGDVHLSLERNMKCGVGTCGHCQLGPVFVCKDGPVFTFAEVEDLMAVREL